MTIEPGVVPAVNNEEDNTPVEEYEYNPGGLTVEENMSDREFNAIPLGLGIPPER
jgi:hypothetical protein